MKTLMAVLFAGVVAAGSPSVFAQDAKVKSVAALHSEKTALAGQLVQLKGKVVKVNNGIMGRNFVHVQDGTGDADSNKLIVTSKDTAGVGQTVNVTGRVGVNRDFGSGYTYPLLVEEAKISVAN